LHNSGLICNQATALFHIFALLCFALINENGNLITGDRDGQPAEVLNTFFSSVSSRNVNEDKEMMDFPSRVKKGTFLTLCSSVPIHKAIRKLKSNLAAGPDDFPRCCSNMLVGMLSHCQ